MWSAVVRADVGDAFEAMTATKSDSITQALLRRDYDGAVAIIDDWLRIYETLPAENKEQYKQQKINGLYITTCAYTAAGEIDKALESFEVLVGIGYTNYKQATTDKRLRALRGKEQFETLLKTVEERGDFLGILKNSGTYKQQKNPAEVRFTYPRKDSNLGELRSRYALDAVAGTGEEHSRIIRLMRWVHETVPYEGRRPNAESANTLEMLDAAIEGQKFNCRDLAIILKDVYQSMGFASRYVYCMPKDTLDPDCHVVTVVFSQSQNKWVMMDPSNGAYLMDERGRLLGLEEARQRIIATKPIMLNHEADQNATPIPQEDYLFGYLVKNMYWFESPLSSAYNYESYHPGKKIDFMRLYPLGFGATGSIPYKYGTCYITHDAVQFWKTPEFEP